MDDTATDSIGHDERTGRMAAGMEILTKKVSVLAVKCDEVAGRRTAVGNE